jgi:phospholipid transport system substrate-binding protein
MRCSNVARVSRSISETGGWGASQNASALGVRVAGASRGARRATVLAAVIAVAIVTAAKPAAAFTPTDQAPASAPCGGPTAGARPGAAPASFVIRPPVHPAGAAIPAPLDTLRRTELQLRSTVARRLPDWSPETDARRLRIDQLLQDLLDFDDIACHALESTWPTLTEVQRRDFVTTFTALTRRSLLAQASWRRAHLTYENQVIAGPTATVLVKVTTPDPLPRPDPVEHLEYKLTLKEGRWLVTDILVDGSSTVVSYQHQFAALVKKEGFGGLMARMRGRLAARRTE